MITQTCCSALRLVAAVEQVAVSYVCIQTVITQVEDFKGNAAQEQQQDVPDVIATFALGVAHYQ